MYIAEVLVVSSFSSRQIIPPTTLGSEFEEKTDFNVRGSWNKITREKFGVFSGSTILW